MPIVEQLLEQRTSGTFLPPQPLLNNMTGHYCGLTVRIEESQSGAHRLVMRPTSSASTEYPFVLQWLGWSEHQSVGMFRKVMGPEQWLPSTWPGCSAVHSGQKLQLCPVSCNRKMARGSADVIFFQFDSIQQAMQLSSQDGFNCHKSNNDTTIK